MMEYKGYAATIEYDDEANLLHGRVINVRDVITFQAQEVNELQREFEASVDDYLEFCAERGEQPEKPYSGRIPLRLESLLHRDIAIAAAGARQSLNAWIADTLRQAVRHQRVASPVANVVYTAKIDMALASQHVETAPYPARGATSAVVQARTLTSSLFAPMGNDEEDCLHG